MTFWILVVIGAGLLAIWFTLPKHKGDEPTFGKENPMELFH